MICCVLTGAAAPELYEVPVMQIQGQSETVVEHRTPVGAVTANSNAMLALYEGSSSAASSLFYQYVPSKVRLGIEQSCWIIHIYIYDEK